MLLLLAWLLSD